MIQQPIDAYLYPLFANQTHGASLAICGGPDRSESAQGIVYGFGCLDSQTLATEASEASRGVRRGSNRSAADRSPRSLTSSQGAVTIYAL